MTKGNAITSVTLRTSRKGQDSYYVGIDELDKRDFYLEITYADGGKYRLRKRRQQRQLWKPFPYLCGDQCGRAGTL